MYNYIIYICTYTCIYLYVCVYIYILELAIRSRFERTVRKICVIHNTLLPATRTHTHTHTHTHTGDSQIDVGRHGQFFACDAPGRTYIYIYIYIFMYIYVYMCTYVYMYMCIYVYINICMCMYVYTTQR